MKIIFWKYGFRIWIFNFSLALLGPRDTPLFSERYGYRKPVIKFGKWRVFKDFNTMGGAL